MKYLVNKKHKDATPFDALVDAPITDNYIVPYGKYKGHKIGDVPKDYLLYIFNKGLNDNAICYYINNMQRPKHLEGTKGLYEIRVEVGSNIYRIFSFFDKGNLVVLGNAYQKKSQKTPKQELEKAIKIMEEYQNESKK